MAKGKTPTYSAGNKGFTLIELLLVLLILSVVMGLVIPRFGDWAQDMELRKDGSMVMMALGKARLRSVKESMKVMVLRGDKGKALYVDSQKYPLNPNFYLASVGTSGRFMAFYPDGSSDGGSVDLVGPSSMMRVKVNPLTGRTSLQKMPLPQKDRKKP